MTRRSFTIACIIGVCGVSSLSAAAQSTYPIRPMRVLTSGAAGGGSDLTTRSIANALSQA